MLATVFVAWFGGTLAVGAGVPAPLTPAGGDRRPAAEAVQHRDSAIVTAVSAPVIERRQVALSPREQPATPPTVEATRSGAQSPGNRRSAAPRATVIRNGYLSVNAAYQATRNDFTEAWQFTVNQEASSAQVRYPISAGVQFDVSAGGRVWRDLIVGAGVSRYTRGTPASASADVAHPLYFSQMRHVQGDSSPLSHAETALHMHAMWMFAPVRKLHVGVFGGPTIMRLAQTVVTGVQYSDSYPYDTATFSGVTTAAQTGSKFTAHAGADVAFMFTPLVGLGAVVRFSRATIPLRTPDGGTLNVTAGGLQGGVGLRLAF